MLNGTERKPGSVPRPLAPYRPAKSQEVLRRGAAETGFRASRPEARSGAQSKKPRVVRGSVRLQGRLSMLEGLVVAEREGFEPSIRYNRIPDFESAPKRYS